MNITEQVGAFRPGQVLTREEFTPELQNRMIDNYFGIKPEPTQQTLNPGHVAISQAELDQLRAENENFRTVFTAPGVAERIGDILTGRTHTTTAPSGMTNQGQPNPNTGVNPPPAPQGQQNQNEAVPKSDDLWADMFGVSQPQPNENPTPDDQLTNGQNGVQGAPMNQQQNMQQTPQSDPTNEYVNSVAAEALKMGVRPNEVIDFVSSLTPAQIVEMFVNSRGVQNTPPPPNHDMHNLAEERTPDRPIRTYSGIGGSVPWQGLKV